MNGYFTSITLSGEKMEPYQANSHTHPTDTYWKHKRGHCGQRKSLRTQQLALIVSEMKKDGRIRGKERKPFRKSPKWRSTRRFSSSPTILWRQRRRRGSTRTHLSSPGGTPPEAAPASRCARTDRAAQTPCAPSGPWAPVCRASAAAACSSLCFLSLSAPHRATEAWSKDKKTFISTY